jgi:hypothetical protein
LNQSEIAIFFFAPLRLGVRLQCWLLRGKGAKSAKGAKENVSFSLAPLLFLGGFSRFVHNFGLEQMF